MPDDTGVGPALSETVETRRHDESRELDEFERRTFAAWDPASLGDLRRAIDRRRRELAR